MKYAWCIAAILGSQCIVVALEYPPRDGDLAWQRWLGHVILTTGRIPRALGAETYTAPGAPWTPQEWLFSVFASLSPDGLSWAAFTAGITACALAAFLLTAYRAARRGARPADIAFVAAVTGTAMVSQFGVRAQVVAWLPISLLLLLTDTEGPWLWACVPVAALWGNLHASALLAPLIVGCVALGRLWEDRSWTPRVRRTVFVTLAVAVAICCNPLGAAVPLYAVSLFTNPITSFITEWRTTDVGNYGFALAALPLLLGAMILGVVRPGEKKARAEDMLLFAVFTFLLFHAVRNVVIFSMAIAPLCDGLFHDAFEEKRHGRAFAFVLPVSTIVLAVLVGAASHVNPARTEQTFPKQEIGVLASMPGEHRVFCGDFSWCSYFLGKKSVTVFLDGRSDPYPLRVWKDYREITYSRPHWYELLNVYKVDSILDERVSSLDQAIASRSDWRDVAHDEKYRLWVRK